MNANRQVLSGSVITYIRFSPHRPVADFRRELHSDSSTDICFHQSHHAVRPEGEPHRSADRSSQLPPPTNFLCVSLRERSRWGDFAATNAAPTASRMDNVLPHHRGRCPVFRFGESCPAVNRGCVSHSLSRLRYAPTTRLYSGRPGWLNVHISSNPTPQGDCVLSHGPNTTFWRYSSFHAAINRRFLTPTFAVFSFCNNLNANRHNVDKCESARP